tara:strand:+ start:320 stop:1249 length:930 start_codon:yes stop_codon:yes gene_type:complete
MKNKTLRIVQISFGFILLFALFYTFGLSAIIDALLTTKPFYLLLATVFFLLTFLIGAFNIYVLLRSTPHKYSFLDILKSYLLSSSVASFFPGKLGEFSLLYYLKKDKVKLGTSSAIFFMDKIITLLVVLLLAFVAILSYYDLAIALKIGLIGLLVLILGTFLFLLKPTRNFITKYILRKHASSFKGFMPTITHCFKNHKFLLLANILITFLRWIIRTLLTYTLFLSLGFDIALAPIIFILALETLVALIPITINGLGTKHAVAVYAYQQILTVPGHITLTRLLLGHILRYLFSAIWLLVLKKKDTRSVA